MSKKTPFSALIIICCLVISVTGIYNNFVWSTHNENMFLVKALIDPLNLSWAFISDFTIRVNGVNYVNLIFEVLLFAGAILYAVSKQTESRLIRFVASVIFMSNILAFAYGIIFLLFLKHIKSLDAKHILTDVAFYIVELFWIFLSYKTLQYFSAQKELQKDVYGEGEATVSYFTESSRWQRLTDVWIDIPVIIMLFSPLMTFYIFSTDREAMMTGFTAHTDHNVYFVMVTLSAIVYYLLFETILGITPGKLMTESRIVDYNGDKPAFKNVAIRTLVRNIPFESLSFFSHNGWHDKLSETLVVKEKRTGVNGGFYLMILPVAVFLVILLSIINIQITQHKEMAGYKSIRDGRQKAMEQKINNASTNDFFELRHLPKSPGEISYTSEYLKVERIAADDITFSVLSLSGSGYGEIPHSEVEYVYSTHKDTLAKVTFSKKELLAAIKVEDYAYNEVIDTDAALKIKKQRYSIKSVDEYFMPDVQLAQQPPSMYTAAYIIWLDNKGWKANITAIQVVQGDFKVTTSLPMLLNKGGGRIEAQAAKDADYKLNITVTDTLNRKFIYHIEGNTGDNVTTMVRVN